MTTYLEISALQVLPPSNVNRDDTGAPKTAMYGGVMRSRVSSQSWKRAMRKAFNDTLDPKASGRRTKQIVALLMETLVALSPESEAAAEQYATWALEAAKLKIVKPSKKDEGAIGEMGYLMFVSQQQIDAIARLIKETLESGATDEKDFKAAMVQAKVRDLLDAEHSIDIALFGRMVADAPDLNVDAACQVAHAIGVNAVTSEFDYFTAVDDVVEGKEEAGAGMIGTVEFSSNTLYRYAALNVDQLAKNLGDAEATRLAIEHFVRAFVEAVPSGKQNTFAHQTRPSVVLATVAKGQPTSLVGAFEQPVPDGQGHLAVAVEQLAQHAKEVFETWRRPSTALICGLPSQLGSLAELGDVVSMDDLVTRAAADGMQA